MSAEKTVKLQARTILKTNFVKAVVAMLIVLLPFYIVDGATTALSCGIMSFVADEELAAILIYSIGIPIEIAAWFLFSPVINGYIRAYYKAAYSGRMNLKDVFFYFGAGRYGRALKLNLGFLLRMFLPTLLFCSPLIIFEIMYVFINSEFIGPVVYNDIKFLLTAASLFTTTLYSLRYFTLFTVSTDNPQFTTKQIFECNRYIMRENTGSAAKLVISFIPWMLLCLLVLPMLYVIPYMTMSFCVSAKWLTKAAVEE